jgi:magnesium-transporting ATPase (P-type)
MGAERQKIRAAEWLYRWNLSMGILGIVFTILTFMGVFTLVLGPLFTQQFGFTFLETGLVLLATVLAVIVGFGVYLDKVIAFWAAQATVATVRNPYLVTTLYQKELLALTYIQAPMLKALRALLEAPRIDDRTKQSLLSELDRSLARVEQSIRDKRWPIEPHERVY